MLLCMGARSRAREMTAFRYAAPCTSVNQIGDSSFLKAANALTCVGGRRGVRPGIVLLSWPCRCLRRNRPRSSRLPRGARRARAGRSVVDGDVAEVAASWLRVGRQADGPLCPPAEEKRLKSLKDGRSSCSVLLKLHTVNACSGCMEPSASAGRRYNIIRELQRTIHP